MGFETISIKLAAVSMMQPKNKNKEFQNKFAYSMMESSMVEKAASVTRDSVDLFSNGTLKKLVFGICHLNLLISIWHVE
jgi:hypothetical protein